MAGVALAVPGKTSAAATRCFLEPDPLVLELYANAGPPTWVDPMLKEFTASLVVSRPVGANT